MYVIWSPWEVYQYLQGYVWREACPQYVSVCTVNCWVHQTGTSLSLCTTALPCKSIRDRFSKKVNYQLVFTVHLHFDVLHFNQTHIIFTRCLPFPPVWRFRFVCLIILYLATASGGRVIFNPTYIILYTQQVRFLNFTASSSPSNWYYRHNESIRIIIVELISVHFGSLLYISLLLFSLLLVYIFTGNIY